MLNSEYTLVYSRERTDDKAFAWIGWTPYLFGIRFFGQACFMQSSKSACSVSFRPQLFELEFTSG
jgi:hypothetical protein